LDCPVARRHPERRRTGSHYASYSTPSRRRPRRMVTAKQRGSCARDLRHSIAAPGFKTLFQKKEIRDESNQSLRATLAIDSRPDRPRGYYGTCGYPGTGAHVSQRLHSSRTVTDGHFCPPGAAAVGAQTRQSVMPHRPLGVLCLTDDCSTCIICDSVDLSWEEDRSSRKITEYTTRSRCGGGIAVLRE